MDLEEIRPGSSASNSSISISGNSLRSTPTPLNGDDESTACPASINGDFNNSAYVLADYRKKAQLPRSQSNLLRNSSSSSILVSTDDEYKKSVRSKSKINRHSSEGSTIDESMKDSERSPLLHVESVIRRYHSSRNTSLSRGYRNDLLKNDVNISHEDLSDVSDMESDKGVYSFKKGKHEKMPYEEAKEVPVVAFSEIISKTIDDNSNNAIIADLRQKLDQKKLKSKVVETDEKDNIDIANVSSSQILEELVRVNDEDALDFEAEEGECQEPQKKVLQEKEKQNEGKLFQSNDKLEDGAELEEGEVTDEDEKRPEETEPKPICRFYTRGQCTWGMSCRFLHPGVTDKGNYTMFDLVRTVPLQGGVTGNRSGTSFVPHQVEYHDFRTDRPSQLHRTSLHSHPTSGSYSAHSESMSTLTSSLISGGPVLVESAWERGLRTAKEMMRKANKRKEQDMDFEDKKMNLTLSPDELDKDSYYLRERSTPPKVASAFSRHGTYQESSSCVYTPPDGFGRSLPLFEEVDSYGRASRYRELPPHRMPQYEDERRVRPTREVIVQRVEQTGRADEWNDPWMRSKSPGGRGTSDRSDRHRRDRSYSSHSSYSSSTSSDSDSSSDSSHSTSPSEQRCHYSSAYKSPTKRRHNRIPGSPSSLQKRKRSFPNIRRSPNSKRGVHMTSLPPNEMREYKGTKFSPLSKRSLNEKLKRQRTSSSSGSGSSGSSASDSDSDSRSSSTKSSSISRNRSDMKRVEKVGVNEKIVANKEPAKNRSPISIEFKKITTVGASALISPTNSASSERDTKKTRREELLKQLRAVEDAIAKKRSKLA